MVTFNSFFIVDDFVCCWSWSFLSIRRFLIKWREIVWMQMRCEGGKWRRVQLFSKRKFENLMTSFKVQITGTNYRNEMLRDVKELSSSPRVQWNWSNSSSEHQKTINCEYWNVMNCEKIINHRKESKIHTHLVHTRNIREKHEKPITCVYANNKFRQLIKSVDSYTWKSFIVTSTSLTSSSFESWIILHCFTQK